MTHWIPKSVRYYDCSRCGFRQSDASYRMTKGAPCRRCERRQTQFRDTANNLLDNARYSVPKHLRVGRDEDGE